MNISINNINKTLNKTCDEIIYKKPNSSEFNFKHVILRDIKSRDTAEEFIKISGYAAVFNNIDYHKDIILSGAFDEDLKLFDNKEKRICLLAHHNEKNPLGNICKITQDSKGLYIEAKIYKDQVETMLWNQIKGGLLGALSVGIIPTEVADNHGNRNIIKASLIEISVVSVAANPLARIHSVELS